MAKNYLIKIGSFWLTDDGTETGEPCKTVVTNADAVLFGRVGNTNTMRDGTAKIELAAVSGRGVDFEIQIASLANDLTTDLRAFMQNLIDSDFTARVAVTNPDNSADAFLIGGAPNFAPVPFSSGLFSGGRTKNIVLRFKTANLPA